MEYRKQFFPSQTAKRTFFITLLCNLIITAIMLVLVFGLYVRYRDTQNEVTSISNTFHVTTNLSAEKINTLLPMLKSSVVKVSIKKTLPHQTIIIADYKKIPDILSENTNPEITLASQIAKTPKQWLVVQAASQDSTPWLLYIILTLLVYIICIFSLIATCIRNLAVPLNVFTQATKRLSLNLSTAPIEETGSQENRMAIHAFNEMNARIHNLIFERTQMLAAISHDIRTPITRMKMRTENYLDEDMQAKFLHDLDEMEHLADQVLKFTEKENQPLIKEPLNLNELLSDVCQQLIDVGHNVYLQESTDLIGFKGDKLLIKRSLANLISNAAKYGNIAKVNLFTSEDEIIIHIDDEGPGIPADELEKVFIPFYRVEKSRSSETGGTGLGLIIAKRGITASGGKINLINLDEGGLRVIVTLPR